MPRLLQGPAAVVLCQLLGQMKVTNFKAPDDAVFSGRSRAPCIAALHKFNKGWLFPLKDVLVFIGEDFLLLCALQTPNRFRQCL